MTKYKILDELILDSICKKNRTTLKNVKNWFSIEVANKSYFHYGVPDDIKDLLDLDIGNELTYTDLIAYYARLFEKVSYLELGVSVGKNFLQLSNQFNNACLTGFDIENINYILEEKYEFISIEKWETLSTSIRKGESYIKRFQFNSNQIDYLAGDIWDEKSWEKLYNKKFNIVFSDALHEPDALLWEFEMLKRYNLIDNQFIIFWDDINHGLEKSFFQIAKECIKKYGVKDGEIHLIKINGWLGQNYPIKHDLGFISTINLY